MVSPTYPTAVAGQTASPMVLVDPATGEPYSAGGSGGGLNGTVDKTSYQVITAASGYSVGDVIDRFTVLDSTGTPQSVHWVNVTTGLALSGAPSSANITPVLTAGMGSPTDAAASTDTGTFSLIALIKRLLVYMADTTAAAFFPLPTTPVSGTSAAAITDTTDHSILAAPAAGKFNYVTAVVISNAHATTDSEVVLKDGLAGAVIATFPGPHLSGATLALPTPLKQPTSATAMYAADLTTGAAVKVTLIGYQA